MGAAVALLTAGLLILFTFAQPRLAPLLVGGLGGIGVFIWLVLFRPWFALLTGLALSSLYLISEEGIGAGEIVYFAYFGAILLPVSVFQVITGRYRLLTSQDGWFLFLGILLPAAAVLGYLNGAGVQRIVGDLTFFSFLLAFAAFRAPMSDERYRSALIITLLLLCLYILIRNVLNYQQIILEATMEWQTKTARSTSREILMVFGASFFLSSASVTESWLRRVLALSMVGLFVVGLVITQSRGYWIGCLLSFFAILVVAKPAQRVRLIGILFGIIVILTGAVLLFLRDELLLVLKGLAERIGSFGQLSRDISLQERVLETGQILDRILKNPIAGYGLGIEYPRYYMFLGHIVNTTYIHNGYLAAWFKLGLPGLVTMALLIVGLLRQSFKLIRGRSERIHSVLLAPIELSFSMAMFGVMSCMVVINITSPQFYSFEGWMLLTLFGAYLSYRGGVVDAKE